MSKENTEKIFQHYEIPEMLTIPETARKFGLPENAVRRWVKMGLVPHVSCGRKWLVNAAVFSRFLGADCQQTHQAEIIDSADQQSDNKKPLRQPRVIII